MDAKYYRRAVVVAIGGCVALLALCLYLGRPW